ncbi:MAG: biotin--[acetyl-CoA-carboxylase] ligase [Propionicimonas sp.]|uniref:biotin--[acetyl-CoA-carboxylase] ligase n=1 Tax=Propionicimonas sp. TaxID=1955623 RepID=UPI003D107C0D
MNPAQTPPLVDADRLAAALVRPGTVWTRVATVASTGSTNADLAASARAGAASGTVLVSDHQSAGRGRFARVWEAPPGRSLAMSVLLRPPASLPAERWLWLPLVAGLAVAEGIRDACGVAAELKWPNDVLVGGGKVCGILSERVDGDGPAAAIIGMGLNTTLAEDELPVPTATSLALAGADVDPTGVASGVLGALGRWYTRWLAADDLRGEYAARCSTVGRRVRVQVSQQEFVEGTATGVDDAGCLLVEVAGRTRTFAAGDVVHLR